MRKRLRAIGLVGVVLASGQAMGEPPASAPAKEMPLASVTTLAELHKQPAVRTGSWDVQLGMGTSGKDGGPWVVVYCAAAMTKKGAHGELARLADERLPLGPVYVSVEWDGRLHAHAMVHSAPVDAPDDANLYAVTIPIAWKGTCRISVEDSNRNVVATKDVEVKEAAKSYWHRFTRGTSLARVAYAVYPWIDGHSPFFPVAAPNVKSDAGEGRDAVVGLPAESPVDTRWGMMYGSELKKHAGLLTVKLEDGHFVLSSLAGKMAWGSQEFAARWWVNGQAVEAKEPTILREEAATRVPEPATQVKVKFGLPAVLGALKEGDTVGLQVMYAPDGVRPLMGKSLAMHAARLGGKTLARTVLTSNRIDFKVTEDMLQKEGDLEERRMLRKE